MPIPDFDTIMTPLLSFVKDGNEHSMSDIVEKLFDRSSLICLDSRTNYSSRVKDSNPL